MRIFIFALILTLQPVASFARGGFCSAVFGEREIVRSGEYRSYEPAYFRGSMVDSLTWVTYRFREFSDGTREHQQVEAALGGQVLDSSWKEAPLRRRQNETETFRNPRFPAPTLIRSGTFNRHESVLMRGSMTPTEAPASYEFREYSDRSRDERRIDVYGDKQYATDWHEVDFRRAEGERTDFRHQSYPAPEVIRTGTFFRYAYGREPFPSYGRWLFTFEFRELSDGTREERKVNITAGIKRALSEWKQVETPLP